MRLLERAARAVDPETANDYSADNLRALVAELADELAGLAKETKDYAEHAAVSLDGEFGNSSSLTDLIKGGEMPEAWMRAEALLKA